MDQTTHTPRHREDLLRPFDFEGETYDFSSRAIDPPPVHPSGIVAGKRRQSTSLAASERGAAVAWLLTAVWMVGLLMVGMYGFLRMLEQAAATR